MINYRLIVERREIHRYSICLYDEHSLIFVQKHRGRDGMMMKSTQRFR